MYTIFFVVALRRHCGRLALAKFDVTTYVRSSERNARGLFGGLALDGQTHTKIIST